MYLTYRASRFVGPGFTTRTRSSTKSPTRNINSHQRSKLSTMMKSLDTETTAKSKSSPNGESGGENSNIRGWWRILREIGSRRRIRDNLHGMHKMRPYDQGGNREVSTVWTGAMTWLKGVLRRPNNANKHVSRTTRAMMHTRTPRSGRRYARSRSTTRASQLPRSYPGFQEQSTERIRKSKQLSKELVQLINERASEANGTN